MKNRIHERYIKQAIRIREDFIRNMQKIIESEKEINTHKDSIVNLMKSNEKYITENSDKDLDMIKNTIKDDLLEIDSKIEKITKELSPMIQKTEKLEKESKELFSAIKDKYPNLSEEDIQKEIFYSIKR
jgi:predicted transcriptional regulator